MKYQALLVSMIAASGVVHAEEEKKQPPYWGGFAELGSIITTGNTDTSSLNAKFGAKRKGIQWDSSYKLQALTSREDGDVSKETYYGAAQFDRNFTERSYLAIHVDHERARFSGYTYETTASVGYGYRVLDGDINNLDVEVGPGYSRKKLEDSSELEEEGIARLVADYSWQINEGTQFMQHLVAELGQESSSYESETGLKSQLNGSLATKITYTVSYTDNVPADTENTDTEFGVTLVYSY